jgi:hypothetical protein
VTSSESIISRHLGKQIFLDSNLLLLLLIGRFQRERIEKFKRTSNFSPEHVKDAWSRSFGFDMKVLVEVFHPSTEIADFNSFRLFRLTDAAIHQAGSGMLILTQDSRLAAYLRNTGMDCLALEEIFASA